MYKIISIITYLTPRFFNKNSACLHILSKCWAEFSWKQIFWPNHLAQKVQPFHRKFRFPIQKTEIITDWIWTNLLVEVKGVRPCRAGFGVFGTFGSSGGSSSKYRRNRCSSASFCRAAATDWAGLVPETVEPGPLLATPVSEKVKWRIYGKS